MQTEPRYAGFWIRSTAEFIDTTVLTIASWALEYACLWIFYWIWASIKMKSGEAVPPFSDAFNAFYLQLINVGFYFCLAFPYYVWGQFRWGTTLGKRPFRVYVVDAKTLGPITLGQSIKRFFGYGVSALLFMTGYLMVAFHPQKRGFHDLIAGTVSVIRPSSVRRDT